MKTVNRKFEIGGVYTFNYSRLHEVRPTGDDVTIELKPWCKVELIERLVFDADKMKTDFATRSEELAEYIKGVRRLETLMERKRGGKLTDREIAEVRRLQNETQAAKAALFPMRGKETDKRRAAENLFMRHYAPENIELADDGEVQAVYAGKAITSTGKTVHRWYVLGEATTRRAYTKGLKEYIYVE